MAKQLDMAGVFPTPALFRAARGLLGMGQEDLAQKTGFARKTIILIEAHVGSTMDARREAVVRELAAFLEKEGIEFLWPKGGEGGGVRFVDRMVEVKVVSNLRAQIERRKADRKRKAAASERKKTAKKATKRN
jgi:DNA-binding XRE family transcriptional regulator